MTVMTTEEIIERLRLLKPQILQKYRVKELKLFGSRVRKDQNQESDIDILVDFNDEADLFDLTGLSNFLEDELKQKVDIVPKSSIRQEIQDSIVNEAVAV